MKALGLEAHTQGTLFVLLASLYIAALTFLHDWPAFHPDTIFVLELGRILEKGGSIKSGLYLFESNQSFQTTYSLGPWLYYKIFELAGRDFLQTLVLLVQLLSGLVCFRILSSSNVDGKTSSITALAVALEPIAFFYSSFIRTDGLCLLLALTALRALQETDRTRANAAKASALLALIPFVWITGAIYLLLVTIFACSAFYLRRKWTTLFVFALVGTTCTVVLLLLVNMQMPSAIQMTLTLSGQSTSSPVLMQTIKSILFYSAVPTLFCIYFLAKSRSALGWSLFALVVTLYSLSDPYPARAVYFSGALWLISIAVMSESAGSVKVSIAWIYPAIALFLLRCLVAFGSGAPPIQSTLEARIATAIKDTEPSVVLDLTYLAYFPTVATNAVYLSPITFSNVSAETLMNPDTLIIMPAQSTVLPMRMVRLDPDLLLAENYCQLDSSAMMTGKDAFWLPSLLKRTYLGYRHGVGEIEFWSRCNRAQRPL